MNLLELRFYPIEGKQYCFKVSVEGSSGEVHHEPSLPFLEGEIPDVQDRRFTVVKVLESTKFNQNNFDEQEQAWLLREKILLADKSAFTPQYLAAIGGKLYQVLGTSIQQVIEAAVADAKRDRTWLHIRLRFPADDPKYDRLTDYPWELLHNDYGFLAHQGVTFSRYIAYRSPRRNLPPVELLNILLISSGAGDERMKLEPLPPIEREAIRQGLQKAQEQGKIQLELLSPPTLNRLRQRLLERQASPIPHVLHFDGHGFFGKRCNEDGCRKAYKQNVTQCECGALLGEPQGYLVFERADGTADYVSATELGELLGNLERREQSNSEQGIALVVLSACRSGMSRLSESVFNGVAQNLIGQGIPAVVAMSYSISVSAASAFSEYFYRSLGEKESLAIAVARGQSAMGIEGNQWYRPVLYLRWEDNEGVRWEDNEGGQLFTHTEPVPEIPLPNKLVLPNPDDPKHQVTDNNKLSLAQRLKKESLEKRLVVLEEDYQALERDHREAGDSDTRNRLQSKLDRKLEEIEETTKELNELRNSSIIQLIDILNQIFSFHKNDILCAYNLSLPNRLIDKEKIPQNATELISGLQLPHQQDTYSYIDKFVGYLFLLLRQTVSVELKRELTQWAENNINDYEQLRQQLTEELNKQAEELNKQEQQCYPGLLVAISEREGSYVLEAWLLKNITQDSQYSPSDFEQIKINQQAEIPTNETLSNVPELLKKMIAQSLEKCRKSLKQIHIFLPVKLMNHAVDCWKNWQGDEEDEYSTTIGDYCEVLLRCSERLKGNDPSVVKWRDKAYILKSKLSKPAEQVFILANSDNPRSLFKQLYLDDEILAVKITTVFQQQKEPGTLLWKAGIPIALWVRQQLPEIKNQSVLDNILKDCCLEKVPNKVKQERFNAFDYNPPESHIGRHLCLLWDDPNLRPPEQPVTQNYL